MGASPIRLALAGMLASACGFDSLDHAADEPLVVTFGGEDGTGPSSGPLANFPEPATTRCGSLPEGVEPIEGLLAAWVVVALPGATDAQANPIPTGTARLRLSNRPLFDCSAPFEPDILFEGDPQDEITRDWGFGMTLDPDELAVASIELDALAHPALELVVDGESSTSAPSGELVLSMVSARCVIGELREVELPRSSPSIFGGFVAEICERTCVPGREQDCW